MGRRQTRRWSGACAALETEYAQLRREIQDCAARGHADREDRLRNRAQVVLGHMRARRCPMPKTL